MILVTGAAGKTGRAVIGALARRGQGARALVRREAQAAEMMALGAREAMTGDLRDAGALERACRGVRAVYHICPNINPDEVAIGLTMIAAARAARVEQFVFHSVLHPQTQAMPHHWRKLFVEEALFESGLSFTILQPASYMQNLLPGWRDILTRGVYAMPYAVHTRLGLVDLEDVGTAAAVVLTEPGYAAATYELAGPEVHTQEQVAGVLSEVLRRPVRAEAIPHDAWAARARAAGLGPDQIETLIKMFVYYERHGFWGNPRVLTSLIGRAPTTLRAFIERTTARLP
jgi:uncharacterized protein YbjT (DUF2867 family)